MTSSSRETVVGLLRELQDPWLEASLLTAADIDSVAVEGGKASIALTTAYPCEQGAEQLKQLISDYVSELPDINTVDIQLGSKVPMAPRVSEEAGLTNVKNIIAVASGKGGVGKSTTAVNLAMALSEDGAKVGILDADIYGPSIGQMLGIPEGRRPDVTDVGEQQMFVPIEAYGLKSNSMAYLVTEQTPMVWRGPMASGALLQLLNQTAWGELDYLVVDLPPGTGDIQLTLAQKVPVAGSVIVTTPQDLALLDARKGVEMFRKVEVPVLGIVENMSVHVCSNCGHAEHLFGEGGGSRMAEEYQTKVLGSLPLAMTIREKMDSGRPIVADSETKEAQLYIETARRVAIKLALQNRQSAPIPTITISDD
ncbi:iron-sulfur cluster carrier protein ApbC [Sansalvadorimonas sp. 2012CJ34-2]|uniref:Iron-sulfur cluster carrier protein n=1 Tax=Parendozoicomonas callyspongiae TaxID=2942213 RepID=A0ABT0PJZ3_9GAMM|nr:iron-sulfur cluster carrier protein ApbC [Sansalvadorimonas sp. 2012CJ34-2]MCL6271561.1 iron-sulfur cluster carrier protein ApbC [Sansalvadorimonas sp. 2012CJ34-2]